MHPFYRKNLQKKRRPEQTRAPFIQKELIKSDSLVRTGRNFGRTFIATMTEEEFTILQITGNKNFSPTSVPFLVSALLDTCDDLDLISELEQLIQKKKEELTH